MSNEKDEERYLRLLEDKEFLDTIGVSGGNGCYTITSKEPVGENGRFLVSMTGTGGVINYIKALEKSIEEEMKSYQKSKIYEKSKTNQ